MQWASARRLHMRLILGLVLACSLLGVASGQGDLPDYEEFCRHVAQTTPASEFPVAVLNLRTGSGVLGGVVVDDLGNTLEWTSEDPSREQVTGFRTRNVLDTDEPILDWNESESIFTITFPDGRVESYDKSTGKRVSELQPVDESVVANSGSTPITHFEFRLQLEDCHGYPILPHEIQSLKAEVEPFSPLPVQHEQGTYVLHYSRRPDPAGEDPPEVTRRKIQSFVQTLCAAETAIGLLLKGINSSGSAAGAGAAGAGGSTAGAAVAVAVLALGAVCATDWVTSQATNLQFGELTAGLVSGGLYDRLSVHVVLESGAYTNPRNRPRWPGQNFTAYEVYTLPKQGTTSSMTIERVIKICRPQASTVSLVRADASYRAPKKLASQERKTFSWSAFRAGTSPYSRSFDGLLSWPEAAVEFSEEMARQYQLQLVGDSTPSWLDAQYTWTVVPSFHARNQRSFTARYPLTLTGQSVLKPTGTLKHFGRGDLEGWSYDFELRYHVRLFPERKIIAALHLPNVTKDDRDGRATSVYFSTASQLELFTIGNPRSTQLLKQMSSVGPYARKRVLKQRISQTYQDSVALSEPWTKYRIRIETPLKQNHGTTRIGNSGKGDPHVFRRNELVLCHAELAQDLGLTEEQKSGPIDLYLKAEASLTVERATFEPIIWSNRVLPQRFETSFATSTSFEEWPDK